jgi:hypothetical protein
MDKGLHEGGGCHQHRRPCTQKFGEMWPAQGTQQKFEKNIFAICLFHTNTQKITAKIWRKMSI